MQALKTNSSNWKVISMINYNSFKLNSYSTIIYIVYKSYKKENKLLPCESMCERERDLGSENHQFLYIRPPWCPLGRFYRHIQHRIVLNHLEHDRISFSIKIDVVQQFRVYFTQLLETVGKLRALHINVETDDGWCQLCKQHRALGLVQIQPCPQSHRV